MGEAIGGIIALCFGLTIIVMTFLIGSWALDIFFDLPTVIWWIKADGIAMMTSFVALMLVIIVV